MGYLEILDSYKDDMLRTLKESVSFASFEDAPVRTTVGEYYPCGRGVQMALEHMLNEGKSLGFESFNASNYGGHIEWKAEAVSGKAETFGIACHLDVVPVSKNWETDPFSMVVKDGVAYGRGVSDDKGPTVACLYALKALKEAGLKPKKNIRLILGIDEETGSGCMERYLEMAGQPDLGFTPDGDFPLIHGEKGILYFDLAQKLTKSTSKDGIRLTKLEAGVAANSVPSAARAVVASSDSKVYESLKDRANQYAMETGFNIKTKRQGSSLVIETTGIAAHGASPEAGVNALSILLDFLGRVQFTNEELNDYIAYYNEFIGFNVHGENLGCALEDEVSGKLSWNAGLASFTEEMASITINARYPVSFTDEDVYSGVEKTLENTRIGIVKKSSEPPIFMPLESPLVEQLMSAYIEVTGDVVNKPMVIGGGTYAKVLNNTLAFGGLFPGETDTMHQANERLELESFYRMARIYAIAIERTCF